MAPELQVADTLGEVGGKAGLNRELKIYRSFVALLLALIIVVFVGMFAAMFLAVQTAKELSASHGQLTDTSGQRLSTGTVRESVDGVAVSSARLLSGSSGNRSGYEIPPGVFEKTKDKMKSGSAVVVVKMPDDQYYTARIEGMADNFAWGKYVDVDESAERTWSVSCPVDGSGVSSAMCPIETHVGHRELMERGSHEMHAGPDLDRALWDGRKKD